MSTSTKKVVAFVGSTRKKHTNDGVRQLMRNLQALGDIEYEIVPLGDYRIDMCRGCKLCLDRGEELCPLKDDRDLLIEKMTAAALASTRSRGVASPPWSR